MSQYLNIVLEYIETFNVEIIFGMLIILILLVLFLLIHSIKTNRKLKKYQSKVDQTTNSYLEKEISKVKADLKNKDSDIENILLRIEDIEESLDISIKRVGFKRYNAFEGDGNELSYSLALLNSHNIGILITSIYNNASSISYSKRIVDGRSNVSLSKEEEEVLEMAMRSKY